MKMKSLFLVLAISVSWLSATIWDGKQLDATTRLAILTQKLEKIFTDEGNKPEQAGRMAVLFRQLIGPAFLKLQENTFKDIHILLRSRKNAGLPRIAYLDGLVSLLGAPESIPLLRTREDVYLNSKKISSEINDLARLGGYFFNPRMLILQAQQYQPTANFLQSIQELTNTGKTIVAPEYFYHVLQLIVADLMESYEDQVKDELLSFAAKVGSTDRAKKYLKMGANPNYLEQGVPASTPLQKAILRDSFEMVKLLLEAGADPNIGGGGAASGGNSPLHLATQMGTNKKVSNAIVEILKKYGAIDGFTPLTYAAYINDVEKVKWLLEHNANPNTVAPNGRTALYWAKQRGNQMIIELLKKYNAQI